MSGAQARASDAVGRWRRDARRVASGCASVLVAIVVATAAAAETADRIEVRKSERLLLLYADDIEIRRYAVALGGAPIGDKQREGDERTPEGRYVIDWRNADSAYHLSLHISYPDAVDRAEAASRGEDPGGMIMIHGLPDGFGWIGSLHRLIDWTNGCIAVTNSEIEEIWARVPNGTPIDVVP